MIRILLVAGVHLGAAATVFGDEPHRHAERITGLVGVENVARIAPGLYRGGAPQPRGLDELKALGIRTVVNLRHYHGHREEKACRERGLDYVPLPTESSDAPTEKQVRRFLEIVTDPSRQPVYFHCWRGKDRTGALCAAYRMSVEGWSLSDALEEMDAFGFFRGWRDLRRFVEEYTPTPTFSTPPDAAATGARGR